MDAREKLRRYLEQRREMGESELVLDSMTVDEALRIVSGSASSSGSASPRSTEPAATRAESSEQAGRPDGPGTSDWRAALLASGAGPEMSERRTEFIEAGAPPVEPSSALEALDRSW